MSSVKKRPRLLLTPGDPNGIGPELILRVFNDNSFSKKFDLSVIGSKTIFDYYSSLLYLKSLPQNKLIEIPFPVRLNIKPGKIDKAAGKFSGESVKKSVELCLNKNFDGVVTLPISKESFNLGGFKYHGHTEMLAKLTRSDDTVMILHSKEFGSQHAPVVGQDDVAHCELVPRNPPPSA